MHVNRSESTLPIKWYLKITRQGLKFNRRIPLLMCEERAPFQYLRPWTKLQDITEIHVICEVRLQKVKRVLSSW